MTEEINFECLLPGTRQVLEKLRDESRFLADYVMVGGSALSLRLCHRFSEDLDFFAFGNRFDKKPIFDFFSGSDYRMINDTQDQIDLVYEGVRITFFNANWEFLRPAEASSLNVAPLELLAGMKVHTLFLRATYRDYYDLYVISQKMGLSEMYQAALRFIDGLNYKLFSMALIYVDDIADDNISHLKPQFHITKQQISEHFVSKLKNP